MRYTKFIIKNFKGIQNLELNLDRDPNLSIFTLVGLNESGKTSILEAINIIQSGFNTENAHKLIPKKDKISFTDDISISAICNFSDDDLTKLNKLANQMGYKKIKINNPFQFCRSAKFINTALDDIINSWSVDLGLLQNNSNEWYYPEAKEEIWQKIIIYIRDNLIPKIIYYPDFLFNFPHKIYLYRETAAIKSQLMFHNVIQDILNSIDKNFTIEQQLLKRIESDDDASKEALDLVLSKMSNKVTKIVLGAWKNIINITGKEIILELKKSEKNIDYNNKSYPSHYIEFKLKEGTEKYYISERSLGFKWFFTFLLFTEFRRNRTTDLGETIFLLDEPASNLHSTAQKKLLAKFSELVTNSKLIYTTHSHHLINPEWLNNTFIVKNDAIDYNQDIDFDETQTNISATPYKQFVANSTKQQDYFQPILDALEFQPALLEKVPEIIITEGKTDFFLFKYFQKYYFEKQYSNLKFYPGGGANQNDAVISLYIAWNRDFIVLLDADNAGISAKKRYFEKYGKIISSNIITLNDILPELNNAIESIFEKSEIESIAKKHSTTTKNFSKKDFHNAIECLLLTGEKITLSQKTISKIENVFQFLIDRLLEIKKNNSM